MRTVAPPRRTRISRSTYSQIQVVEPLREEKKGVLSLLPPPQPGPQARFVESDAEIVIYGGAAFGGKTFALLLDFARYFDTPEYRAVIFRRESPQITNEGGLWDTATELYAKLNGIHFVVGDHEIRASCGSTLRFTHLQHEKTKLNWQGAQVDRVGFDELTHFSFGQFMYLVTRVRSQRFQTKIRATCNPDPDSWLVCDDKGEWGNGLISWWIHPETGDPIPERSGVVRWFVRLDGVLTWGDSWEDLVERYGDAIAPVGTTTVDKTTGELPKSLTFIPSSIFDNKIGLANDPGYLGNLQMQGAAERAALLEGNWKVQAGPGKIFSREWFEVVDEAPLGGIEWRTYDFASTAAEMATENSYYSACVKGKEVGGVLYILDAQAELLGPADADEWVKENAFIDGKQCRVRWEEEGGSSGPKASHYLKEVLTGFANSAEGVKPIKDKVTRAKPAAQDAKQGKIKLVRGGWNGLFKGCVHKFDGSKQPKVNDVTDSFSLLHLMAMSGRKGFDLW